MEDSVTSSRAKVLDREAIPYIRLIAMANPVLLLHKMEWKSATITPQDGKEVGKGCRQGVFLCPKSYCYNITWIQFKCLIYISEILTLLRLVWWCVGLSQHFRDDTQQQNVPLSVSASFAVGGQAVQRSFFSKSTVKETPKVFSYTWV